MGASTCTSRVIRTRWCLTRRRTKRCPSLRRSRGTAYWAKITLFNLATLYQRVGSLQRALETYKQLEQSPEGLSAGDRAHLYGNLGTIYRRLGDPWKAIASYRRATDLYARDRDSDGELGVLKNIGIVEALELGRLPDALRTFTAVLAAAEKAGNKREVLQAHLYRGEALLRMNRIPDAAREFETALSGASELGAAEDRWKALYGVGRTQEKTGDLPGAEQNYREAIGTDRIHAIQTRACLPAGRIPGRQTRCLRRAHPSADRTK